MTTRFFKISALFPAGNCRKNSFAQSPALPWNNKQAAVVLTYDDGLNINLTNVIPALDKVGLKGTFYIADFGKAAITDTKMESLLLQTAMN
jgi:peptidoglycan/xylan/chitin deacetylase (PgdA/CDA1 family)